MDDLDLGVCVRRTRYAIEQASDVGVITRNLSDLVCLLGLGKGGAVHVSLSRHYTSFAEFLLRAVVASGWLTSFSSYEKRILVSVFFSPAFPAVDVFLSLVSAIKTCPASSSQPETEAKVDYLLEYVVEMLDCFVFKDKRVPQLLRELRKDVTLNGSGE